MVTTLVLFFAVAADKVDYVERFKSHMWHPLPGKSPDIIGADVYRFEYLFANGTASEMASLGYWHSQNEAIKGQIISWGPPGVFDKWNADITFRRIAWNRVSALRWQLPWHNDSRVAWSKIEYLHTDGRVTDRFPDDYSFGSGWTTRYRRQRPEEAVVDLVENLMRVRDAIGEDNFRDGRMPNPLPFYKSLERGVHAGY